MTSQSRPFRKNPFSGMEMTSQTIVAYESPPARYALQPTSMIQPTQQGQLLIRQNEKQNDRAAEQHFKSTQTEAHQDKRSQDNRDSLSLAAGSQDQEQKQPSSSAVNDEMHPWLKARRYEKMTFILDPEAGLKEDEESSCLRTLEEDDPDVFNY
ncbi:hypothetical protein AJ78_07819 [Emergomyces pasteurianus Ep9510]|uniref:Uncharacterized protein n=1 Tax=Emergomyces pasteurianus Ep9510 TaxID=1447872 RepID=A0A1J9P3V3_9EURO|nr:hypothetical protein AJ78_07819 [Emergomyces pasteurianus Ep9510]